MPKLFQSSDEAQAFVQARINTREWWIIPAANAEGLQLLSDIFTKHYTGDDRLLFDLVTFFTAIPDAPLVCLGLASKSCMSPEQLGKLVGRPLPADGSRDVVATASMPLSAMAWLCSSFDWPLPE